MKGGFEMIRLKELRERKGITQLEFSKDMGVAPSTVGMWEQGRNEPDSETLKSIAQYFNISLDYLMGNETPEYYNDPEVARIAQEMHDEPGRRVLFDASRGLSKESIEEVRKFIEFQKAKEEGL